VSFGSLPARDETTEVGRLAQRTVRLAQAVLRHRGCWPGRNAASLDGSTVEHDGTTRASARSVPASRLLISDDWRGGNGGQPPRRFGAVRQNVGIRNVARGVEGGGVTEQRASAR
jgi:hypothetical protein